jgi:hypothetical protein
MRIERMIAVDKLVAGIWVVMLFIGNRSGLLPCLQLVSCQAWHGGGQIPICHSRIGIRLPSCDEMHLTRYWYGLLHSMDWDYQPD